MFENNLKEIKNRILKWVREREKEREKNAFDGKYLYVLCLIFKTEHYIYAFQHIFPYFCIFFGSPEINLFMFLLLKLLNSCKLCVYINTRHIFGNKMHAQNL